MSKKGKQGKKQQAHTPKEQQGAEATAIETNAEAVEAGEEPKLTVAQKMTKQLKEARVRYVATTTASGNKSLCNGDPVAKLLEGKSPEDVMSIVEGKLGMKPGTLVARYANLNPGQKRMNAGNLLRGAVKSGKAEV